MLQEFLRGTQKSDWTSDQAAIPNMLIFSLAFFLLLCFAKRREVGVHDVHNTIVVHQTTEALEMSKELLRLVVLAWLVNVSDQNQSSWVKR